MAIARRLAHLLGHNEIMLGIDCHLHVVADEILLFSLHLAALRIAQRHSLFATALQLVEYLLITALLLLELSDLLGQFFPIGSATDPFGLSILAVQFTQIMVDPTFDRADQLGQLGRAVIASALIKRFEFGPI